jgi:vacuolar-type H+-ATPase subunit H
MYYVYDGRVFDDRDDLNDYRDDKPGFTTQRFNTKAEADSFLGGMLTGNPSSDPTKRQPGETGPFDPNAELPSPAPTPEPEAELAPPKPLPDTKQPVQQSSTERPDREELYTEAEEERLAEIENQFQARILSEREERSAREAETGEREYVYVFNRDLDEGQERDHLGTVTEVRTVSGQNGLRNLYNSSNQYKKSFGSVDNFIEYMDGMYALQQANPDTYNWWETYNYDEWFNSNYSPQDRRQMDFDQRTSGDDLDTDPYGNQELRDEYRISRTNEYKNSFQEFSTNPDYQQLLLDHNVQLVTFNSDGDVFQWNGGFPTKMIERGGTSIGDIVTLGFSVALSVLGTPALASALTSTLGAVSANAAASSIVNIATQLMTTGEVDIEDALRSGATSILTGAALDAIEDSGIYDSLQEAVGGTTTDQLLNADGDVIGEIVRDSAGQVISSTGVSANEWYTYATELGGVIQEGQTIVEQLSTVLDTVPDWLYESGFETAETINTVFEEAQSGTGTSESTGGEGVSSTPVVDGVTDIFSDDADSEEESESEEASEDILADTTQEATGLEDSVIEDLFSDYMEEFRSEFEGQQDIMIEQVLEFIANGLANIEQPENLTEEQIQQIVNNAIASIPQADTLSEEQVGGLVSSAVDAVRADLQTGLETAETERQEIIAGQEAIRSELSSDIEALQTRINDLPPEIRAIVSEEIDNLATIGDVSAVEQSINALEQLVNNIQPGTTPEQVRQEIQDALAASEERLGDRITGLEQQMDADAIERLAELTGLRAEFLETLSASEAAAIARNQGLSDQITEEITGVRGETAAQIEGINERLTERISEYEAQTGERLDIAAEERAVLGGQLGTLTDEIAQVAEDLIRADGRIEELDEASRGRFDDLGLSIEELSLRIGVNLEALQTGMLTQDAALRELIEESTTQTEESLTQRLEQAEEGFATSLSDTEANLLSQITGIEAEVLQQLAIVEGGLQSQFGEQFGQIQEQVAGLGEQVAGVGEGLGELGQAIGTGLMSLAAAQPTAQQIASAMPRQPVKFDPFLKGLDPFQPLTPLTLRPIQEKDAVSELNKFIGRQTGMLV